MFVFLGLVLGLSLLIGGGFLLVKGSSGNAVGSNIANLGLVLRIAAVIRPIEINGQIVRRELPLLLLATGVIVVMALDPLLSDIDSTPLVTVASPATYDWVSVVLGLIGLFLGGQLTISNGVELAAVLDVSNAIVGLFVVAIGTSLPELITSIIAAIRREPDLALGNVIGSNLFNSLAVLPISAVIRPVGVPSGGMLDLSVSFLFAAALIPIFWIGRARLGRRVGWLLLFCYGVYVLGRVL